MRPEDESFRTHCPAPSEVARLGPTSMRKPLSRPERDDCGSPQTSIRRHPPWGSAMREYAVAPIQYRGVAMRHVGPRDAALVALSISTWTASSPLGLCAPDRGRGGNNASDFYPPSDDSAHAGWIIQPEMPHDSGRRDATDRLELGQRIKPGRLSQEKSQAPPASSAT
jgi:hypothetical protein